MTTFTRLLKLKEKLLDSHCLNLLVDFLLCDTIIIATKALFIWADVSIRFDGSESTFLMKLCLL